MADIIRVKAKKQCEWDQDAKYIYVKVNVPGHTSINKLEIFLSDLLLRVTSKQKKSVQTLDLAKEVDYLSPENKFVLADGVLSATLKKKNPGENWAALLVQEISLAELKTRRKESEARYEQNSHQLQQNKQKLKTEYDRMATKELMRFEQEQRKKLEKRKQEEKQAALNEVFRNVNSTTGRIENQRNKWEEKGKQDLERLQRQQQEERRRIEEQRKKQLNNKLIKQIKAEEPVINSRNQHSQIFTDVDIKQQQQARIQVQQQIQEIPVRKQAKVNLKFTQKLYPHVATRDYHYTQPPMPKDGIPTAPPRDGDLEARNPLWLKDRGDSFMRYKNYQAALDAYNQAIKIDPTQRKIIMNRSLAHMKCYNLDAAINDCDAVLMQMQKQVVNSQDNKNESLADLIKMRTRKGICLAWKGKFKQSRDLLAEQLGFPIDEATKQQIQDCIDTLSRREQSFATKSKGDDCVKRQTYEQAIEHYNKSIETDGNEYSISNKCLCLNKISRFQQSIKMSEQGIRHVEEFLVAGSSIRNNPEYNSILMKLLYRRSTAEENLGLLKQAEQSLRKALTINPDDKDIQSALAKLKSRQALADHLKLKQQASLQLTQNNNPQQASKLYSKCLKLLQSHQNLSEYLSILQNQCVCYLKMEQYDSIISTCIRILSLVNNVKGKVIEFGEKKQNTGLTKQALNKINVRTLVRRANAYLKTGQVYNAKSDLQKAKEIDPEDKTIQTQLDKLKSSLGIN